MRYLFSILIAMGLFLAISTDAHALMVGKPTYQSEGNTPSTPVEDLNSNDDSIIYTSAKKVNTSFKQPETSEAEYALKLAVGKRYVWGGNSDTDVDCSSFAQQFMRGYKGIEISRTTYDQVKEGTQVNDPEPGDLVFFNDFAHVGVYVGDGMMVDALNPEEGVGLRAVSYVHGKVDGYYRY